MRFRLVFANLFLTAFALAQGGANPTQQPAKKETPKPVPVAAPSAQAAPSPFPKPAPEMEKIIQMMSGRWDVDEDYADTPMTPGGGKGKGISMSHPATGNLSLVTDYRTTSSAGMIGHGMLSWNPADKVYVYYWVDNMAPGGSVSSGRWVGNDLVFDSLQDMNGQKIDMRMTYTDITQDSYTLNFDFAPSGKKEFARMMSYKFTRGMPMMGPRYGPRPMRGATPPPPAPAPQTDKDKPKL